MRNFSFLIMMSVVLVSVSACGSNDDMYLGSRDDIIVNNRGMAKTTPSAEVQSKIETAKADAMKAEAAEEMMAAKEAEMKEAAMREAKDAATEEVMMSKADTMTKEAMTETAKKEMKAQAEKMQDKEPMKEPMMSKPAAGAKPQKVMRAADNNLNCDPNRIPADAVPGGCYARATINTKSTLEKKCVEMRQILCKQNMTVENVKRIQTKLNGLGNIVPIDGVFDESTIKAMDAYQRKHNLPTQALTYESLDHLGVQIADRKQ